MNVEVVVDRLHKHGQRASYAAVGGLVGLPARSVMTGRPKNPRNSWVVSKGTGLPSGYTRAETDARLAGSAAPITTPEELREWLNQRP
jgi:hypothetical protein